MANDSYLRFLQLPRRIAVRRLSALRVDRGDLDPPLRINFERISVRDSIERPLLLQQGIHAEAAASHSNTHQADAGGWAKRWAVYMFFHISIGKHYV